MPSALLVGPDDHHRRVPADERPGCAARASSSPGNHGSCSGGMVLMYGVDTSAGMPTCCSRARSSSFDSRNRARVLPRAVDDGVERVEPLLRSRPGRCRAAGATNPSKIIVSSHGLASRCPVRRDAVAKAPAVARGHRRPMTLARMRVTDGRLHRRGLLAGTPARAAGRGRVPDGAVRRGRRGPHDQPAHGDPGRAGGGADHRRARSRSSATRPTS